VLKDASLKWGDLTRILLVGGSTRMPAVRRMLAAETDLPLDRSLSPDEAVAHGAAIYASLLHAEQSGQATATVRDVNSHDLGVLGTEIATGRPRAAVVIPRNTPLPATKGRRFQTARQNQRSVVVKVIEGGDATGRHATAIGDCVIRDLPQGLPAGSPVDVLFSYGRNGRLVVRACLPRLQHEAILAVERRSGLTDEALGRWKDRLDDEDGPLALG
jgi:molecular chaperone DnaK